MEIGKTGNDNDMVNSPEGTVLRFETKYDNIICLVRNFNAWDIRVLNRYGSFKTVVTKLHRTGKKNGSKPSDMVMKTFNECCKALAMMEDSCRIDLRPKYKNMVMDLISCGYEMTVKYGIIYAKKVTKIGTIDGETEDVSEFLFNTVTDTPYMRTVSAEILEIEYDEIEALVEIDKSLNTNN